MKRLILISLCAVLSGCVGENLGAGEWRSIYIDGPRVCFTVNKNDVLTRYVLSSTQDDGYKELAVADNKTLTYPDTCLNVDMKRGYVYQASYTLNKINYQYSFFIDNTGQLTELAGDKSSRLL